MKKLVLILFFAILACSMPTLGQDNAARHRPVSYGFVIDNSGSFRPLIERVIKLVNSLSEKNSDGDETFLITFVDPTKTKIRQELTSDKAEIREAAENMYVEGGLTAVLDAVRLSIDYLSTNVRNRNDRDLALLLITDGDDATSSAKIETVLAAAKETNVRIIVVGMSDEKINTKLLDRLAKGTGGSAFYPRTPKETESIVDNLASALRGK